MTAFQLKKKGGIIATVITQQTFKLSLEADTYLETLNISPRKRTLPATQFR